MSFRHLQLLFLVASLMLPASAPLAQIVGATINGTVRDSTGAVVAGATVTVRNTQNGATRVVTTDEGLGLESSFEVENYFSELSKNDIFSL
jgi:hypothetical protein